MAGWTTDLAAALGAHLGAAGVGTWRATGAYAAGETGIATKVLPPGPDRAIAITVYAAGGSTHGSDVTVAMQVRCRGAKDPRDVDDLADAVYNALHGARNLTLGDTTLALVWRQSHAVLGPDASGRWETSSNFYAQTAHPSAHVSD